MASDRGSFLRDNAFLVAAVALPVTVAAFFLLATAIPRWAVPPPRYDALLRVENPYPDTRPKVDLAIAVQDGRVQATVRIAPDFQYVRQWTLLLVDHTTLKAREVPIDVPGDLKAGESRTFVVEALGARRVTSDTKAPDGYELSTRDSGGGGGLVGELFGMGHPRRGPGLVNRGRTVPLELPAPYVDWYGWSVTPVGWVVGDAPQHPAAADPGSH